MGQGGHPVLDDYVKAMKEKGLPGDEALKFCLDFLKKEMKAILQFGSLAIEKDAICRFILTRTLNIDTPFRKGVHERFPAIWSSV